MTKNDAFTHRVLFAAVTAIALAWHLALFFAFKPWDPSVVAAKVVVSDARQYHDLAVRLLDTKSFADFGAFRTPGYPLFVAMIYALVGTEPWVVLLIQILLSVSTGVLIAAITRRVSGSPQAALIALLLAAINPLFAVMALQLMTETLFTFLLAVCVLGCLTAFASRKSWRFAAAGFLLGLTSLVRPLSWYLPWVIAPFILLQPSVARSLRLKQTLLFLGVFFLTLFPWQMRNYHAYGAYALSTVADYNLLEYNAARVKSIIEGISLDQARADLNQPIPPSVTNPFARAQAQKRSALAYLAHYPFVYACYHFKGGVNMLLGTVKGELLHIAGRTPVFSASSTVEETFGDRVARVARNMQREYYLTPLLLFQLSIEYAGFVIGAIGLARRNMSFLTAFFLAVMVYFFVTVGMVGSARFRHPVTVLYLPLGAYGLWTVGVWVRRRLGKDRSYAHAQ